MFSGRINNVIACIKQGQINKRNQIEYKNSRKIFNFLQKLQKLGYIYGFSCVKESKKKITIFLKYDIFGVPLIKNICALSRPGRFYSVSYQKLLLLKKRHYGYATYVLSTAKYGYVSDVEALKYRVGGQIICYIY